MSPAASSAEDAGVFGFALVERGTTLGLAASRGGPPPEVLDQIAGAGAIDARLRESGQHLCFIEPEFGESTTIEIRDRDGNTMRTLSTIEAFDLAAGSPLE